VRETSYAIRLSALSTISTMSFNSSIAWPLLRAEQPPLLLVVADSSDVLHQRRISSTDAARLRPTPWRILHRFLRNSCGRPGVAWAVDVAARTTPMWSWAASGPGGDPDTPGAIPLVCGQPEKGLSANLLRTGSTSGPRRSPRASPQQLVLTRVPPLRTAAGGGSQCRPISKVNSWAPIRMWSPSARFALVRIR